MPIDDPLQRAASSIVAGVLDAVTNFLSAKKKKLFISHKVSNSRQVADLARKLREVSDVATYASEEMPAGIKWRNNIVQAIERSDALILVFTNPDDNWDWCMFEVGMFHAKNPEAHIYCLHHAKNATPAPIDDIQSITLEPGAVTDWLRQCSKQYPRRQDVTEATLKAAADEIIGLFHKEPILEHKNFVPVADLNLDDLTINQTDWCDLAKPDPDIRLGNSKLQLDGESAKCLGISGNDVSLSLEGFCAHLSTDDRYGSVWTRKFEIDAIKALRRNNFEHEPVYFRTSKGEIWRPLVVNVTRKASGAPYRCRVGFINSVFVPTSENTDKLQLLAIIVRLGVRTRVDVIEKYSGKMSALREAALADQRSGGALFPIRIGFQVVSAMTAILNEGRIHRAPNDNSIPVLFGSAKQRQFVSMVEEFGTLWPKLKAATEEEDAAHSDYGKSEACLDELRDINKRFMDLIVREFVVVGRYKV